MILHFRTFCLRFVGYISKTKIFHSKKLFKRTGLDGKKEEEKMSSVLDEVDEAGSTRRHQHLFNNPAHHVDTKQPDPNLEDEIQRIRTFYGWPSKAPVTPYGLAKWGFYYLKKADCVKCFFCKLELKSWQDGDDVCERHFKNSPHCPMFNTGSESSKPEARSTRSNNIQSDVSPKNSAKSTPKANITIDQFIPRYAKHPNYQKFKSREDTFDSWPANSSQKPKELAEAGFFYTGQGDKVLCYVCGNNLQGWEPDDKPWTEHQRWFPKCEMVLFYMTKVPTHPQHSSNLEKTDDIGGYESTDAHNGCLDQSVVLNQKPQRSSTFTDEAFEFAGDELHYSIGGVTQIIEDKQTQEMICQPVDQPGMMPEWTMPQQTSGPADMYTLDTG